MTDFHADAESRYLEAVERRNQIRDAWVREKRPLLSTGSTGQTTEHPLVKMLREHDRLVDHLAVAVRRRHAGPDPSGVFVPSIGESPAARLRQVK